MGLGPEDAADVAQETFVTLLRSLPDIRDASALPSWLMTVARRLSWRRALSADDTRRLVGDGETDPSDDIVDAIWVFGAVERLGEPCGSLVRWLYLDDTEPSYADVAARLGCALGTVGPMRIRCLARLRSILEGGAS
jgi:DNA-directed RNA polymerase specialized sigma24 family protein